MRVRSGRRHVCRCRNARSAPLNMRAAVKMLATRKTFSCALLCSRRHRRRPRPQCPARFAAASPLLRRRIAAASPALRRTRLRSTMERRRSPTRVAAAESRLQIRAAGCGLRAAGLPGVSPPGESRIQAARLKLQTPKSPCCILTTLLLQLHTTQNTDHPSESKDLGLQQVAAGSHICASSFPSIDR